ncbi:MAG: protein-glutamate O-methyltransferase CheR [Candidatus Coatesbacteria bacterium]|nr:protein-glutamate O-methyltransferase CheR [Candidatus Coatesbacteria bacterium]
MQEYNELYLQKILDFLHQKRGIDFSKYKFPCLLRRIQSRIRRIGSLDYQSYYELLASNPDEMNALIDTITINVTSFYRDPSLYREIEHDIFPDIINKKLLQGTKILRIWSAGCASGEEAYSLAILFFEIMKRYIPQGRESNDLPLTIGIYGTDIDKEVLSVAKKGVYNYKSLKNVSEYLLNNYFVKHDYGWQIKQHIKKGVHFFQSDLTGNKHFICFDLIMCRNVMIYFNEELQTKILWNFHKSLNQNGYLILGKSETLLREAYTLFRHINNKERIYQKIG